VRFPGAAIRAGYGLPSRRAFGAHGHEPTSLGPGKPSASRRASIEWVVFMTGRDRRQAQREINVPLADLEIKARPADHGSSGLPGSPDHFRKPIAQDTEKWGRGDQARGYQSGLM